MPTNVLYETVSRELEKSCVDPFKEIRPLIDELVAETDTKKIRVLSGAFAKRAAEIYDEITYNRLNFHVQMLLGYKDMMNIVDIFNSRTKKI